MYRLCGRISILALAAAAAAGLGNAAAEEVDPTLLGVMERQRPDYDARGLRAGSFLFYPSLTAETVYDDNVFATDKNREDDLVQTVRPQLQVKSDWARHSANFLVATENVKHRDFESEDQTNFFAGFKGTLDIRNDLTVAAVFDYTHAHEMRGSGESFNLFDDPVEYDRLEGGATVNKRYNRFWTSFGFGARHDDFDDTSIDYVNVDQDYRDGERFVLVSRVGYDISPLTAIFAETSHNWRSYDEDLFESDGVRVVGGIKFEPTRVVKGQVYAGWLEQDYDSDELDDISTWTLGGLLAWHPSPLLTVTLVGNREAEESSFDGGSSLIQTEYGLRADYELLRSLIVSGLVGFEIDDYQGAGREDDYVKAGLSALYYVNRSWAVGVNYRYTNLDSDAVSEYSRNQIGLTVKAQY